MSGNFTNVSNSTELFNNNTIIAEFETRSIFAIWIISFVLIIIMLTTIFGNIGVIFAIANTAKLRKDASYVLIINLAITDLTNGSLVMPSAFTGIVMDSWKLGQAVCDITCALNYCLMITSMLTLFFISVDRYQAIVHPLQYHGRVTKKCIVSATIYTWLQGIIFSIIPVILRWIEYDYWEAICAINWFKEQQQAVYYVLAAFILCYFIPGVLMAFCYTKISCIAKLKSSKSPGLRRSVTIRDQNSGNKVIRSLTVVVIAYFICLTPFSVTKLMKVISKNSVQTYANTVASLIAYCSSAVNPWIYGIFRRDFRQAYKRLFVRLVNNRSSLQRSSDLEIPSSKTSTQTI